MMGHKMMRYKTKGLWETKRGMMGDKMKGSKMQDEG